MVRTMLSFRGTGFGVLYYVARNSQTVGIALRRVAAHYHMTSTLAQSELGEEPHVARLNLVQHDYLSSAFRQIISALWTISNVTVLRQLLGEGFSPISVGLEQPAVREGLEVFASTLRCPIEFDSPVSTIAIEPTLLAASVQNPDPVVEAAMLHYIEEMSARLSDRGIGAAPVASAAITVAASTMADARRTVPSQADVRRRSAYVKSPFSAQNQSRMSSRCMGEIVLLPSSSTQAPGGNRRVRQKARRARQRETTCGAGRGQGRRRAKARRLGA